jgi:NADH-quinone oxidoreductase subunit F
MREVVVGLGSCGIAAGGLAVQQRLGELLTPWRDRVMLKETGCIGMCHREVLVEVRDDSGRGTLYGDMTPERADRVVREHVLQGKAIGEWTVDRERFLARQKRIVLRNCGEIDPSRIEEYQARGGYRALEQAVTGMTPEQVIETVADSGLRGRGGAGFPTGTKWRLARLARDRHRYVICNGDEGDPGAFMDRSVLEGDPHSVLEGMAIAGYAVGASEGYIYLRAEYPLAIRRVQGALAAARERGFLGPNLFGSCFGFSIRMKEGAGAFVCGEETALIASIEGRRGMPRVRPPFPTESGLWGHPTVINNVETLANVGWIVSHGSEAFRSCGTEKSKGTKVFALAGKVRRGGLVEVPMGTSIDEVVYDIGGGTPSGEPFKAVQMGGPSGGCIPASLGGTPIDYERITATGAIMGSGGMVVMDNATCMVDVARYFLSFTQNESCGKCTFCRIGTKRMLEILERICAGRGNAEALDTLAELGEQVKASSLCGLGQTAANPVLTTLRYFHDEYEAHIRDSKCPARVCLALVDFSIDPEKCDGCGRCAGACDAGAISGEAGEVHQIDRSRCVKCGKCAGVCNRGAVIKE